MSAKHARLSGTTTSFLSQWTWATDQGTTALGKLITHRQVSQARLSRSGGVEVTWANIVATNDTKFPRQPFDTYLIYSDVTEPWT